MFRSVLGVGFLLLCMISICVLCTPTAARADHIKLGFIASGQVPDDDSFNVMALAGLRKLQKDHDLEVETRCGGYSEKDFTSAVESLLAAECKIIVVNCSCCLVSILQAVKKYPDIYFILNDVRVNGYQNVSSVYFGQCKGSFLVGVLCALQTRTGRVGFIGGNDGPVIREFLSGFLQGVTASEHLVDTDVRFLRGGSAQKGFEDPRQAHSLAKEMYGSGVDIIYCAAGLSGNGVIQAAVETHNFVVGVDSNQDYMAKGTILTSMMKRLDIAVYEEVLSVLEKRFVPGSKLYDLNNGGVGLTDMQYSRNLIDPSILEIIDDFSGKLSKGELELDCSGN